MTTTYVPKPWVNWARSTALSFSLFFHPQHDPNQSVEDYTRMNFVGILGELAASQQLLGDVMPAVQSRTDGLYTAIRDGRPSVHNDFDGFDIDVKSALIPVDRQPEDFHLLVMPKNFSREQIYVFVAVHTPRTAWESPRPWKCTLVGWAQGYELNEPGEKWNGSYWLRGSRLNPIDSLML